jgi:hypothetical protein
MTISFVAGDAAAADTIALPSLTIGDTIIGIGLAPAAGSVSITVPAGWSLPVVAAVSNGRSRAYACKVVDDPAFTFGTWTNATKVAYLILRGDDSIVYPQNLSGTFVAANTTLTHPNVSSVVFTANDNELQPLLIASASIVSNGAEAAVSGFTQVFRSTLASHDLVVDLSDTVVSSQVTTTRTMLSNTNTFGTTVMLKEIPFIVPTGGGSTTHNPFRSRAFGGGPRI